MSYEPSETFAHRMIEVLGSWLDPSNITAVSKVEECATDSEFFFIVSFTKGGALSIESDSQSEVEHAHAVTLQAWDTSIQRAELEKQFERGLEDERSHGVEITLNMPADTPKDDIQQALNQATAAILDRVEDVGGGL